MANSSADSQSDEFARIYPRGEEAENAFDSVYSDATLSEHHGSFFRAERRTRSPDSDSDISSSDRHDLPSKENEYWVGYYSLSLRDPVKDKTSIGWRMGKGFIGVLADPAYGDDQGVDLILIRPGKRSKQTAPVHARIRFHPRSGVLMLVGVEKDRPVCYKTHDASTLLQLGQGDRHVLYQKSNMFWVGRLQYDLVFTGFDKEQYTAFVGRRDMMLYGSEASFSGLLPHAAISAVPRAEDMKRGKVITHGMIGYGGFGRVFPAVDAETGEPLAVKRHAPTTQHHLRAITLEVDIARQVPQDVFTSSPLAIWDFSQVPWLQCTNRQILEAFYGSLQGLVYLHADGLMHRDVTLKNMFVMSLNPIRAVLGDFGKAIRAQKHQSASIGPAATRAPEVDGRTQYDNKIDVWSMGWAFVYAYNPHLFPPESEPFVLQTWHMRVVEFLEPTTVADSWYAKLAHLLIGMLALDPSQRISAAEALAQVSCLLAASPPSQMYLQAPQTPAQQKLSLKHTSSASNLVQRDSQLELGGCPFTIAEQVPKESVDARNKKARLL
ncbi:MAG: hypothetical protein Q9170_008067 [Blastenia crenularia]